MFKYKIILLSLFTALYPGKYTVAAAWNNPPQIMVKINGSPVFEDEFEFTKQRLRTDCLIYFTNKYGTYDRADFWQHSFNGEVPDKWLIKRSLDACIDQRLLLSIMNNYGVLKGFTYLSFKYRWEQENIARNNKVKSGGIVYGTVDFDEQTYYAYIISKAVLATKQEIAKACIFSEKQWNAYYKKIKTKHFKKLPSKQIILYKCDGDKIIDSLSINFGPMSNKTDDLVWNKVYTESLHLNKAGQQTDRFKDETGNDCFVKCIAITNNDFFTFPDMIDNVKMIYADEVITKLMKQLRGKSVVKLIR